MGGRAYHPQRLRPFHSTRFSALVEPGFVPPVQLRHSVLAYPQIHAEEPVAIAQGNNEAEVVRVGPPKLDDGVVVEVVVVRVADEYNVYLWECSGGAGRGVVAHGTKVLRG